MNTKIAAIFASVVAVSLISSSVPASDAVAYYGHDGSVDQYLEKTKVAPYKGKKDLWAYIVKACATDRTLSISHIILKSDIDQKTLGVNKSIKKGDCASFGAVMKAKDGKTLGAELVEKHEAYSRMQAILDEAPAMSSASKKVAFKEYRQLQQITGFILN